MSSPLPALLLLVLFGVLLARTLELDPEAPGRLLFHTERSRYIWVLTRLPRNLDLLGGVLLFLVSAAGPGEFLLTILRVRFADEVERLLLGVLAGLCLYTFAFMGLGWAGLLSPAPLLATFGAATLVTAVYAARTAVRLRAAPRPRPRVTPARLAAAVALAFAVAWLAYTALLPALGPEAEFDARWYHLAVPYHYALQHGFFDAVRVTRITAAAFTPYQESLYAGLIPLLGTIGAKLLHWADAVLGAALLVYFCRVHLGSAVMGLMAALVFLATPVVSWSMGTGGNDLPLAPLTIVTAHCFLRWRAGGKSGWLAAAGLFGGYAVGVKFTGAIGLLLLGLAVIYEVIFGSGSGSGRLRRLPGLAAALALPAALVCLPWLIRSYQLSADPVFPFLYQTFRTPYWGELAQSYLTQAYGQYGAQHTLPAFLRLPWDLTFSPQTYRSLIGPLYLAAAPVALVAVALARGRTAPPVRLVALLFAGLVVGWFASAAVEVRYADGAVALAALLVAYGFYQVATAWPARRAGAAAVVAALAVTTVLNSQLFVEVYRDGWADGVMAARNLIYWDYVYGRASESATVDLPVDAWINAHLVPGHDKVYDAEQKLIATYLYVDPEVFNGSFYDSPAALGQWSLWSPDALAHLEAGHVNYVAVNGAQLVRLRVTPLSAHLHEIYRNPEWDTVILKIG